MTNRTTLLLIGATLSLVFAWPSITLRAQKLTPDQQKEMLRPIEQPKLQFDPARFPGHPVNPPPDLRYRPPAWLEFLNGNPSLAAPLFAAAVVIVVSIPIGICRMVLGLVRPCRSHDSGDGPSARPAKPLALVLGGLIICAGLALFFFALQNQDGALLPFGTVAVVFFGLILVVVGLPRPPRGTGG
jgi:hypothetical protein